MSTLKSSAEDLTLNADGSGNDIIFQSNGSNVATLDQAGLLTATKLTASSTVTGGSFQATGMGVTKWYQPSNSGNPEFYIGASDTNRLGIQTIYDSGAQTLARVSIFTQTTNGTANAGDIRFSIDDVGERLRIDDDGIKFNGDSAAANALDDYEEGTWTPTLPNGGTVGSVPTAKYTKIGNICLVEVVAATLTSIPNDSASFAIGGLPFTVGSYTSGSGGIGYSNNSGYDWSDAGQNWGLSGTHIYWHHIDDSTAGIQNSEVYNMTQINTAGTYITT